MTIDKYALCPGGTGKKIKFCCADLTNELDKLSRMQDAQQYQGCLEYVERLEARYPGRVCLTRIKIDTLRALERTEEAQQLVETMLQQDAHNPAVLSESVLLTLESAQSREDIVKAIDQLQSAIEVEEEWSDVLVQALFHVGVASSESELWQAGQVHVRVYQGVTQDEAATKYLTRLLSLGVIPTALRDSRRFYSTVDDVPWKEEFEDATALAGRVRWRAAAQKLEALAESNDHPYIWANLATLRGWLGDLDGAIEGWKRYLTHEVEYDDAVAVHALVGALQETPIFPHSDIVQVTYPVNQWDPLLERFISHPQIHPAVDALAVDPQGEPSEPSRLMAVADRPGGAPEDRTRMEDFPRWWADLRLYGRETDREARVVVLCESGLVDAVGQVLQDAGGDALGAPGETQPADIRMVTKEYQFRVASHIRLSADEGWSFAKQALRKGLMEVWPDAPNPWLDGGTPRQAAEDPAQRARLEALLSRLENDQVAPYDLAPWPELYTADLRRQLNLPTEYRFEPELWDSPARVHRLRWIAPDSVPDDALLELFQFADTIALSRAVLNLGNELLRRPGELDSQTRLLVHMRLMIAAGTTPEGIDYARRTREAMIAEGMSPAMALSWELPLLARLGRMSEALDLAQAMQRQYRQDGNVLSALQEFYQFLQNASGFPGGAEAEQPKEEAPPSGGKLWTPDSDSPGSSSSSKIWTPS